MDYKELFKRMEKQLKTMTPKEVIATLNDEEKLEVSKMITDMELNKVVLGD